MSDTDKPHIWEGAIRIDPQATPEQKQRLEKMLDFYFDSEQGKESLQTLKNAHAQSGQPLTLTARPQGNGFLNIGYGINIDSSRVGKFADAKNAEIVPESMEEMFAHEVDHATKLLKENPAYTSYLKVKHDNDIKTGNLQKILDNNPEFAFSEQYKNKISELNTATRDKYQDIRDKNPGNWELEESAMRAEDRFRAEVIHSPFRRSYTDGAGAYFAGVEIKNSTPFSYGQSGMKHYAEAANTGKIDTIPMTTASLQRIDPGTEEEFKRNSPQKDIRFYQDAKATYENLKHQVEKTPAQKPVPEKETPPKNKQGSPLENGMAAVQPAAEAKHLSSQVLASLTGVDLTHITQSHGFKIQQTNQIVLGSVLNVKTTGPGQIIPS